MGYINITNQFQCFESYGKKHSIKSIIEILRKKGLILGRKIPLNFVSPIPHKQSDMY